MMSDLKPCPFCGGEAAFHEHERVGVECIECGAGFACVYRDRDEAADKWNRRAERTFRMEYDAVHCDYVCMSCGECYESDTYVAVNGEGGGRHKQMRYCPNCGARVIFK